MSKFLAMLPVRTRAIAPEYSSQWQDEIKIFDSDISGVDYIEAGYPYSRKNRQLFNSQGLETVSTLMFTIDGQPMLTIEGENMLLI